MNGGIRMSRKEYGLPNVLPKGAEESIKDLDLIAAKLKHASEKNVTNVDTIMIGRKR